MESFCPISLCLGGAFVLEISFVDKAEESCFTSSNMSTTWNVSQLAVHYDVVTVDLSFLTSLSTHILSGAALQMQYKNYNTAFYTLLAAAKQITHSRSAIPFHHIFRSGRRHRQAV